MRTLKFEPPKCPSCGKPLEAVCENEYWTYSFDEKNGTYIGDLVGIEIRCPDCNVSLRDEFLEGACNYQTLTSEQDGKLR